MTATALFGADEHLTIAQECARMVVVFVYGFFLVRIAGRRAFGKWSAIDIVVSIVIGSNFSRALTGNAALGGTLVATTGLLLLHWLLTQIASRSRFFSRLVEGKAVDLVRHGRVDEHARRWHGVSHADLDEALRQQGLAGTEEAERVTLEPSGKITVRART